MELRQLKYFIAIAEEGQFVKAATKLYITQSALSQQLEKLEDELGVALFDKIKRRVNRTVELTEEGKTVLKEAKKIVQSADKLIEKIKSEKVGKSIFHLGTYRMLHNKRLIEAIDYINFKHINVEIKISEYDTHLQVQEEVANGQLDYGISIGPVISKDLEIKGLKHSELQLLVHKSHGLAKFSEVDLTQVANEHWVELKRQTHPIYQLIESFCEKAGFNRSENIVQEVNSLDLLCHYVQMKKGIAFIPSFYDVNTAYDLVKIDIKGHVLKFEHVLIRKKK